LCRYYGFRNHPTWCWTHGYIENVAHAIVLAATSPAAGCVYNVGEAYTPTVAERLAKLPPSSIPINTNPKLNFEQDIAYDTTRIRAEIGYSEVVAEEEAMQTTLLCRG